MAALKQRAALLVFSETKRKLFLRWCRLLGLEVPVPGVVLDIGASERAIGPFSFLPGLSNGGLEITPVLLIAATSHGPSLSNQWHANWHLIGFP